MVTPPIAEDQIIRIRRNPWVDNLFRPLLITIMIMCVNISLVNLVRLINPAWRGTYFLLGMLITTVEAIYSYRVLRHYRSRGISLLRYRVAEAVVLIVILKLLSFMNKPLARIGLELRSMWESPTEFLTLEFYIILTLAFMAWIAATQTIADFEDLYDPYRNNTFTLNSLASRFFWGGGILLVISGITQWIALAGVSSLTNWQRPSLSGVIFNVLIYFVLGLVLLSQVNLTVLLIRWRIQKITVAPGLVRQWAKYGLTFLGIIALIAFLLPTRYTLGFLATASLVVGFLIGIIVFIFQLLILLITLPFFWLFSFLGGAREEPTSASPPPVPPSPPGDFSGPAPPWLEILQSLIFWLVALAIVGYLVKSYLEDHPELVSHVKGIKPIRFILNLLTQLWQQLSGWAQAGLEMLPKKVKKSTATAQNAAPTPQQWSLFGLRSLTPRERILGYYLNILKRAAQTGSVRKKDQTPYEYEPHLKQSAPDVQTEIQLITDTFVRARYSQDPFNREQATLVKALWQRIRKALRQRKKKRGD